MNIIDISEHQPPYEINYDELAKHVALAIVRVQYGSARVDHHYHTHLQEFQKRGVPCAVYAWVRGVSYSDMELEAVAFYQRSKDYNPTFYWLDVEEFSMTDMRGGVERFRSKLKEISGQKVGAYIAHHLFHQFNLDTAKFDGIWIPTYGANNGHYNGANPTATSYYDLHQFTSAGRLPGCNTNLDLSRLSGSRPLDYFTNHQTPAPWGIEEKGTFKLNEDIYLRTAPSKQALSIALILKGNKIKYDRYSHENGYVWIRQPRTDGSFGYLATGPSDGKKRTDTAWGEFY